MHAGVFQRRLLHFTSKYSHSNGLNERRFLPKLGRQVAANLWFYDVLSPRQIHLQSPCKWCGQDWRNFITGTPRSPDQGTGTVTGTLSPCVFTLFSFPSSLWSRRDWECSLLFVILLPLHFKHQPKRSMRQNLRYSVLQCITLTGRHSIVSVAGNLESQYKQRSPGSTNALRSGTTTLDGTRIGLWSTCASGRGTALLHRGLQWPNVCVRGCVYVCMCVCVCRGVCVVVVVCMCLCVWMYVCVCLCVCVCVYVVVWIWLCVCVYVFVWIWLCVYVFVCVCAVVGVRGCVCMCLCVCRGVCLGGCLAGCVEVCVYVCVCVLLCVCTFNLFDELIVWSFTTFIHTDVWEASSL